MESLRLLINVDTLACTERVSLMVKVCTSGQMDEHMSATTLMIKNKALASTHGPMVKNTKVSGAMASKRALVVSQTPRVSPALENGTKESVWHG